MQDMTFGHAATRPAMAQNDMPSLGLAVMLGLAVASTMLGLSNPGAIAAEYSTVTVAESPS